MVAAIKHSMTRLSTILGILALMGGCDSGVSAPEGPNFAEFAGSWRAVEFTMASAADSTIMVDLIAAGASFEVAVQSQGSFVGSASLPGALIGNPAIPMISIPLTGGMRHLSEFQLEISFDPEYPPLFVRSTANVANAGDHMTLQEYRATYDFDGDGVQETALLNGILQHD